MNEESCWVLSGALEYRMDGATITVRAGEILVVPSSLRLTPGLGRVTPSGPTV
jgi:uncharacterized cupin superfamily protein